jgi:hypothetical protein
MQKSLITSKNRESTLKNSYPTSQNNRTDSDQNKWPMYQTIDLN